MIAKMLGTYVSLRNLGLSPSKIHCSMGKVAFSFKNLSDIFQNF